jgi:hypothetical protein
LNNNTISNEGNNFVIVRESILAGFKTLKLLIISFSIIIIFAIVSFTISNRYTIVAAGDSGAYKVDKITGKTYFIVITEIFEVKPDNVQ